MDLYRQSLHEFTLTVSNRRWSPSAQDAAAFVDLSVRRRWGLAAVWFAGGLATCFKLPILVVGWVYRNSPARQLNLC